MRNGVFCTQSYPEDAFKNKRETCNMFQVTFLMNQNEQNENVIFIWLGKIFSPII